VRPNIYWGEMNPQSSAATDTVCIPELCKFPAVKKRLVAASFSGGEVPGDDGLSGRSAPVGHGPAKATPTPTPATKAAQK
jgi:hypothetical protein